jgi:hypothetical protein
MRCSPLAQDQGLNKSKIHRIAILTFLDERHYCEPDRIAGCK